MPPFMEFIGIVTNPEFVGTALEIKGSSDGLLYCQVLIKPTLFSLGMRVKYNVCFDVVPAAK